MQHQIITMLEMQDAMNAKVHADWKAQGFEWYRAIWVECAELMDHYGWKWWKKQQPDRDQVILELIDIWHFGLSVLLSNANDPKDIASQIAEQMSTQREPMEFRLSLECFTQDVLTNKHFSVSLFSQLMVDIGLSFDQLYTNYVGKNVLNLFRQNHGYKEGSYIKVWNGKEDNEHLVTILSTLDIKSADFKNQVYKALSEAYPESIDLDQTIDLIG